MNDQSKISNAQHEIASASIYLNVPVWVIHYAKHITKSNDREFIYDWIRQRDFKVDVTLTTSSTT